MDTKSRKFNSSLIPKTIAFLLAMTMFALSVITSTSYVDKFAKISEYRYEYRYNFFGYLIDEFFSGEEFVLEKNLSFISTFSEVSTDIIRQSKIYGDGSTAAYGKYKRDQENAVTNQKNYFIKNQLDAILGDSKTGSPMTILYLMDEHGSTDLLQKVGDHSKHYLDAELCYEGDYEEFRLRSLGYADYEDYDDEYYDEDLGEFVTAASTPARYNSYLDFDVSGSNGCYQISDKKYQSKNEVPKSVLSKVGKNDYVVELCNCFLEEVDGDDYYSFDGYYKINMEELENYYEVATEGDYNFYGEDYSYEFDNYSDFKRGYTSYINQLNKIKNLRIAVVDNQTKTAVSNDSKVNGKTIEKNTFNSFKQDELCFSINLSTGDRKVYTCNVLGENASQYDKEEYVDSLIRRGADESIKYHKSIENYMDRDGYDYTVYFAFDSTLSQDDVFSDIQATYEELNQTFSKTVAAIAIYLLIMLVCIVYLVIRSGRHSGDDELHMMRADRIFTLLRIAINGTLIVLLSMAGISIMSEIWASSYDLTYLCWPLGICAALAMAFLIDLVLYIARNVKNGTLIKNIFIVWLILKIIHRIPRKEKVEKPIVYRDIMNDVLKKLLLWVALPNIVIGSISVFFVAAEEFFLAFLLLFPLFIYDVFVVVYACRYAYYIREIVRTVNLIRNGDYSIKINTIKMPTALKSFADDINSLNDGLRIAVGKATRDERMKAELITNVSHDLKTPLTSIINYTDLLSRCDITDETARSYIEVLGEKSARLKKLIEDLVEASKASSGAMRVDLSQVSLNELAAQIVGEYTDDFEQRQLDLIVSESSENIIVRADGKLAYRAFDNLMGNVKKYAMTGTRVYLDLSAENGLGVITLKNISSGKLNIPAEELMERFVRADSSRSTEGSGLGLSIAQNLCTLQGGSLEISISGDLFTAEISYPLA